MTVNCHFIRDYKCGVGLDVESGLLLVSRLNNAETLVKLSAVVIALCYPSVLIVTKIYLTCL